MVTGWIHSTEELDSAVTGVALTEYTKLCNFGRQTPEMLRPWMFVCGADRSGRAV
jgi:hypothetical protein